MGAYNILNTDIHCVKCNRLYSIRVQFKFGDTWQLEYAIGDRVVWGGNDIGQQGLTLVKIYGIAEISGCPNCGHLNKDEYDIEVRNDIISEINVMNDYQIYDNDIEGNYVIVSI